MKIQVTQDDIDNGKRRVACMCPVALAVARAVGEEDVAIAGGVNLYGKYGCKVFRYIELDPKVLEFVNRFDECLPVEPFEFELPI